MEAIARGADVSAQGIDLGVLCPWSSPEPDCDDESNRGRTLSAVHGRSVADRARSHGSADGGAAGGRRGSAAAGHPAPRRPARGDAAANDCRLQSRAWRCRAISLRLKRYGDDLALLHPETALTENAEFSRRETVSRSHGADRRRRAVPRALAGAGAGGLRSATPGRFTPPCWWTAASPRCRCAPPSSACGCRSRPATWSNATSRPTRRISRSGCDG
ncbi:MAG: hypothetical protein MZW92_11145 [Comamonadaceae bacterium]|nr:hypothetical protein [Comamonadaceae bacterium]